MTLKFWPQGGIFNIGGGGRGGISVSGNGGIAAMNPLMWLAVDRLTGFANNDAIATLTDLKGNIIDQSTAANQPQYKTNQQNGRPGIVPGTNDYLNLPASVALTTNAAFSFAFVFTEVATQPHYLFDIGSAANTAGSILNNGEARPVAGGLSLQTGLRFSVSTPMVVTGAIQTSGLRFWMSGLKSSYARITNTGTFGARSGGAIGQRASKDFANFLRANIYEMVVLNRVWSESEQAVAESELLNKWGASRITPLGSIVFCGNSLTFAATYIQNMTSADWTHQYHLHNYGENGATTLTMPVPDVSLQVPGGANVCVVWEGTNHLGAGATAVATYNALVAFCAARKAEGWQVIIMSILPRTDAAKPANFDANRATINGNFRTDFDAATSDAYAFGPAVGTTYADLLCDVAADTLIGEDGDSDNTTYYSDKLHMTTAGYNIIGGHVRPAVKLLL